MSAGAASSVRVEADRTVRADKSRCTVQHPSAREELGAAVPDGAISSSSTPDLSNSWSEVAAVTGAVKCPCFSSPDALRVGYETLRNVTKPLQTVTHRYET
jgi:hypothetical protein